MTESQIRVQAEAAAGTFGDYVEALAARWEVALEALGQVVAEVAEALGATMESAMKDWAGAFRCLHITLQRIQLQTMLLRRWRFPYRLAEFVAKRCPERWLPKLDAEKWGQTDDGKGG